MIKTYNVRCGDEIHRFGLDDQGMEVSMLDHDWEAEQIAAQLGAELPGCMYWIKKAVRDHPDSLLNDAATSDQAGIVDLALDLGANVDAWDGEPINHAASSGYIAVVRLLLGRGANPNFDGDDLALRWAVEGGHLDVIKLLLSHPSSL